MHPTADPHAFLFRANVYNFKGPGRFVLGFPDDVDVLGNDGFRKYLRGVAWRGVCFRGNTLWFMNAFYVHVSKLINNVSKAVKKHRPFLVPAITL